MKYKLIWKFGQNHLLLNLRKIVYLTWKNYGLKNTEGIFWFFCIINKKCKSYFCSFLVWHAFFHSSVIYVLHICVNNFKAILNPCETSTILIRILIQFMYVMHDWFRICLSENMYVGGKKGTTMIHNLNNSKNNAINESSLWKVIFEAILFRNFEATFKLTSLLIL